MVRVTTVAVFLSMCAGAGAQFFGSEIGNGDLVTIEAGSVSGTVVGTMGVGPLNGLAADSASGTLYAVNPNTGKIYTINLVTGLATVIGGTISSGAANGLAFDPDSNNLFVSDSFTNELYGYDIASGQVTVIASIFGAASIEGLAYDATKKRLYGLSDASPEFIYEISTSTGVATPFAPLNEPGIWRGLTLDPMTGTLYATAVNAAGASKLAAIDVATGDVAILGGISGVGVFVQGLAWMGSTCYADCNMDGALDCFDFLCFQNEFSVGTPYADCDTSGSHDFFDFLCFQNDFVGGCP